MRVIVACLILFVAPSVALWGLKEFRAQQSLEAQSAAMKPSSTRGEVLFFNASWCGPCRTMKPIVAQLKKQGYRIRDVDVDRNRSLAKKYGVRGIPCFVFLENGSEVKRFSGGTSQDHLRQLCSSSAYH